MRKDYLAKNRDVVIRFAMAYLQGVKEFNAAAAAPDKHPEIVDILAKSTALKSPSVIRAMAPNWSYINEDGMPVGRTRSWGCRISGAGSISTSSRKRSRRDAVFDLSVAKEAKARLDKEKPF